MFTVKAHDQIINCIDGAGGVGVQTGPPEIATGSRDGESISFKEVVATLIIFHIRRCKDLGCAAEG